jgi:hypothetical protein
MGKSNNDQISDVFDKEEKEELDDEEVDKLILNSLCCEIMDEVMDLGNSYPQDCNITPRQKKYLPHRKDIRHQGARQKVRVQNERYIME